MSVLQHRKSKRRVNVWQMSRTWLLYLYWACRWLEWRLRSTT